MPARLIGAAGPARGRVMRRVPGRYFVYGMVAFVVLSFAALVLVALRLNDAADRFHENAPPASGR